MQAERCGESGDGELRWRGRTEGRGAGEDGWGRAGTGWGAARNNKELQYGNGTHDLTANHTQVQKHKEGKCSFMDSGRAIVTKSPLEDTES